MSGSELRSAEFEAELDASGRITVPRDIAGEFQTGMIRVRLTASLIGEELQKRAVTEEEVERIGRLQLEPREQVIKFLLSEDVLRTSGMRRRAR